VVCSSRLFPARVEAGEVVSAYDAMEAWELGVELEFWHEQVVKLATEYRHAIDAEDTVWAAGVGLALDQALGQVKKIKTLLKVGAVA
jgi:hypothetical protein